MGNETKLKIFPKKVTLVFYCKTYILGPDSNFKTLEVWFAEYPFLVLILFFSLVTAELRRDHKKKKKKR